MNDDYISDEELLDLINEIEEGAMLKAPVYLKEQILQQIQKEEDLRHRENSARQPITEHKKNIRKQLLVYKIEVIGTMAAAIIILFLLPVSIPGDASTMSTENKEQSSGIFEYWDMASSQLLEQMDTISNQLLHPLDTLREHFSEESSQTPVQKQNE
ncbi:MAG: hypothetical protein K2N24_09500 [Lachnospiraceae bacterium]|nr:hypothetical protein [Lachnospiraceae bacterium]